MYNLPSADPVVENEPAPEESPTTAGDEMLDDLFGDWGLDVEDSEPDIKPDAEVESDAVSPDPSSPPAQKSSDLDMQAMLDTIKSDEYMSEYMNLRGKGYDGRAVIKALHEQIVSEEGPTNPSPNIDLNKLTQSIREDVAKEFAPLQEKFKQLQERVEMKDKNDAKMMNLGENSRNIASALRHINIPQSDENGKRIEATLKDLGIDYENSKVTEKQIKAALLLTFQQELVGGQNRNVSPNTPPAILGTLADVRAAREKMQGDKNNNVKTAAERGNMWSKIAQHLGNG